MKSVHTGTDQDVSVNIFYNGEFVSSSVYSHQRVFGQATRKKQFCGRRIDTLSEAPWILLPKIQEGILGLGGVAQGSSFEGNWNRVNQLLLEEADEWGRTGKYNMFRAPVGEYLEEISKKSVPESMRNQGTKGAAAGIIDVSCDL